MWDEARHVELAQLSGDWRAKWGGCPPLGHLLRKAFPGKWVRFHSLPGSKRYAEDEDEYQVLLGRHHTLLADLDAPPQLVVVTCEWGDDVEPAGRSRELGALAPGAYWRSVVEAGTAGPESQTYTHLYAGIMPNTSAALDPLLKSVADYQTADVIIAPVGLAWLVHPYDGGVDVIARGTTERNALKAKHSGWLSCHPEGV
ncbi:hypothetical protein [Streptomyces sp. NPDC056491]|uniref:DUF3885 domain-containing protein n=1 Tax=Streptomyces sp. NPDC056491 TaxID=3345837 RepID=UPI0036CB21F0